MLKYNFKILIRSFVKSKGYGMLNILGLAIGITSAALIFLWAEDEIQFDQGFANKDYIYNVPTNQDYNGTIYTFNSTPGQFMPTAIEEVPGIEYGTRYNTETKLFTVDDNAFYKKGSYVDVDFFKMFDVEFLDGSIANLEKDLNAIVLTKKTAIQFFGTDVDLVGRTVKLDNELVSTIAGVVADLPQNVTLRYNWLGNFKAYEVGKDHLQNWYNNSTATYIQVAKNADIESIEKAVKAIIPEKTDRATIFGILYNMNDWHLKKHENGEMVDGAIIYVRMFLFIAFIILIIACINFMNLSTARSAKRAGEVGIRKVLGSNRRQLIFQFFAESISITTIATALSILLLFVVLPFFNSIINKELIIELTNPLHIFALLAVLFSCGFLSGTYPAIYLSSFVPAVVLKGGRSKKGGATIIRNGLVVVQFAASTVLIIATIIFYAQIQHVKKRDVGFEKSDLVSINLYGESINSIDAIKQDMINTGMVEKLGLNSYNLMHGGYNGSGFKWQGKSEEFDPLISFRSIDSDFIPTVGMEILEGRNFYKDPARDGYGDSLAVNYNVIITQSLAKMMGDESAIGKILRRGSDEFEVVGVVKDIQYGSMFNKSDPIFFYNIPENSTLLYARLNDSAPREIALSSLSAIMEKYSPAFPFEYKFVEDTFDAKFSKEALLEQLSKWFAVLTMLISCIGLFGLAAYTAEQRYKEIGVRKVLGASITKIVNLMTKDFLKLVILAIAIAIPIGWWFMSSWLEGYAYRVDLQWWMFLLAAIGTVAIAVITVVFQSFKAATVNPVKSLRSD